MYFQNSISGFWKILKISLYIQQLRSQAILIKFHAIKCTSVQAFHSLLYNILPPRQTHQTSLNIFNTYIFFKQAPQQKRAPYPIKADTVSVIVHPQNRLIIDLQRLTTMARRLLLQGQNVLNQTTALLWTEKYLKLP